MDANFVVFRLQEILKRMHLKKGESFYTGGMCVHYFLMIKSCDDCLVCMVYSWTEWFLLSWMYWCLHYSYAYSVLYCARFLYFSILTNYEKISIFFWILGQTMAKKGRDSVCTTKYEIEKEEYLRRDTKWWKKTRIWSVLWSWNMYLKLVSC
jgi:hypothetical protein